MTSKYQLTAQDYRDLYTLLLGMKEFKSLNENKTIPYFIYATPNKWLSDIILKMSNRMDEFDHGTTGPKMKFS